VRDRLAACDHHPSGLEPRRGSSRLEPRGGLILPSCGAAGSSRPGDCSDLHSRFGRGLLCGMASPDHAAQLEFPGSRSTSRSVSRRPRGKAARVSRDALPRPSGTAQPGHAFLEPNGKVVDTVMIMLESLLPREERQELAPFWDKESALANRDDRTEPEQRPADTEIDTREVLGTSEAHGGSRSTERR
jgi:hypothetical protein